MRSTILVVIVLGCSFGLSEIYNKAFEEELLHVPFNEIPEDGLDAVEHTLGDDFQIQSILGNQSKCNPRVDSTCFARNPGLDDDIFISFTEESPKFTNTGNPGVIEYSLESNLKLTMQNRYDNPSVFSKFYIHYGKVEVEILAAAGSGVVSSFYLQSDDLDEIDVTEMFGGNPFEFQSNFFVKGNTTNYDRGGYHHTPAPPMGEYLKYTIEWTSQCIKWMMNDQLVRTVEKENIHGFPTSPMNLMFSLWAGGDSQNQPGTIQWAGGQTDYSELPFSMSIRNLRVVDYSLGKQYTYGNKNGTWYDVGIDRDEKEYEYGKQGKGKEDKQGNHEVDKDEEETPKMIHVPIKENKTLKESISMAIIVLVCIFWVVI